MFPATMCSSSEGQLYEYNFWYDHSVLVAVQYSGQVGYLPEFYEDVQSERY